MINIANSETAKSTEVWISVETESLAKDQVKQLEKLGVKCKLSAEVGGIIACLNMGSKVLYSKSKGVIDSFCKERKLISEY